MGFPGPAIPERNAFRVHFTGSDASFPAAAKILLDRFKIPFRHFESAEDDLPDEDFWETTLAVVQTENAGDIQNRALGPWMQDHARPECLLVASTSHSDPSTEHKNWIQIPDLWVVQAAGKDSSEATAENWMEQGAGAVAVFHADGSAAWVSMNAAFAKSKGSKGQMAFEPDVGGESPGIGFFLAGATYALMEELLGENLFLKTCASLDRDCLEIRPLHLARAVESGMAAQCVFTENGGMTLLHKDGALDGMRRQLLAWRGPEPKAWGNRGR